MDPGNPSSQDETQSDKGTEMFLKMWMYVKQCHVVNMCI